MSHQRLFSGRDVILVQKNASGWFEPAPGLIIWHAWYNPRCFSFLYAQTQEALRIAGLENAPIRRQAEYWAGRSLMMLALGLQTPPGRMLSGAPHLPDGVSGSLSHSSDNIYCCWGRKVYTRGLILNVD
ncbi:hypothetical protein LCR84_003836 [Salmonella enterica]|nr:hypothetical protein [Salmonella enterica]